ncbi:Restriction modification system DNA specificity domain [Parafrankia sp. Ea1.12]|uniref:restriction endonuclease subunit S n=1 Tax=Parafrankia sp. Ea1.12 TaxID=573499 RepID=UPI000DA5D3DF|nr:restriction endonuclease subunit S [Parafrankia sp. Ea1.12]SQD94887.1 Restriction modification system DNA specificity domain [Parafrankia sp. Ea1.12]
MPEWRRISLADLVRLRRGFDLPAPERRAGRFPVVGSAGVSGWHDRGPLAGPGITLGRSGSSIGTVTYVPSDYWPLNTVLFVEDFQGNDPRFLYFLLRTIDFTRFNSGSAQPSLNRNHIAAVELRAPEYPEQRAIAAVLGALDDKIALNHRLASTARELAEARYAAATRGPGRRELRLGDLVETLTRGITPRYTADDSALVVLNQKCVRAGRVDLAPARGTEPAAVPAAKRLRADDVLVNSTGIGTLGRVARWVHATRATVDSHVTVVRFVPDRLDPVCGAFSMLAAQPRITLMGEGSTGQTELSRAKLNDLVIAVPAAERCAGIGAELAALDARGEAAHAESAALARLRDALSPKLMSGEVRVRDAERTMGSLV